MLMAEQFPESEAEPTAEVTQAELLERFAAHPFANLETYKYFNQRGEKAQQAKQHFIEAATADNTPDAPDFTYSALEVDELASHRDEMTELLQEVLRLDMHDERNRLLREKVTDRLHEIGVMLLTKLQSELDPEDPLYAAASYQLGENMREVYGTPEPEHWRGILGYRLSQLAEIEDRPDVPDDVRQAWEWLRQNLPQDLPIERPYTPQPETFAWYRQQLEERLAPARQAVGDAMERGEIVLNGNEKLDCDNIIAATKRALEARGITGWDVRPTDESSIDTSQQQKVIFVPTDRRMSLEEFDRVIQSHEIDEHVARRVNGDTSGEPILGGTGCAGYLAWEEGNGKVNEGLVAGEVDPSAAAFEYFLSSGLILGYDQEEGMGRNFGQTFDIVWRMKYIEAFLAGKLTADDEEARYKTMDGSYSKLMRLFRGTDGQVPGVFFPKDSMTYYLGQTEVWRKWDKDMQRLEEDERRAEHTLERSAKINPLREDHRRVAMRALEQQAA